MLIVVHGFHGLQNGGFLRQGQVHPAVEELFQFRRQFYHFSLGKELGKGDAEPGADRFQRGDRRDGVAVIDVCNGGVGEAAIFGQPVFRPSPLLQ